MAPLPPCSRTILDETVKTLVVFPSWLYLLDGEDNCMLSVPFSTSDLHFSCWQSGENCQVVAAGGFTLPGYAFFLKAAVLLICLSCCLAHALSARCFLSSRPDTASFRSCLLLPPEGLSTGAFTLLCHVLLTSMKVCSSSFFVVVLPTRLSARCLLSSRLYTASFRSCLLLPPGFLDTREAGICAGSRSCCVPICSLEPRCAL